MRQQHRLQRLITRATDDNNVIVLKRAKKQAKAHEKGLVEQKQDDKTIPLDTVITLDHLTNPDKK